MASRMLVEAYAAPPRRRPGLPRPGRARATELALAVILVLATSPFVWSAFSHAVSVWSTDEEFTYGFLIAPMALALTWWRREALRRSVGVGSNTGLLLAGAAVLLTLVSRRIGIHALAGVAISPLLVGMAVYLYGWRTGREVLFPSAYLIFGLGLYRGLLNSAGFVLQTVTAVGAGSVAQAVGLPIVRDGLVLHSERFAFLVADTCSGMSSLLSLLALAVAWIYVTRGPLPGRIALVLSVLPLVVLANTTRVAFVLLVASWFGQDAALGFFHGASSLVLFGMALCGLLVISRSVGCKVPTFAISS